MEITSCQMIQCADVDSVGIQHEKLEWTKQPWPPATKGKHYTLELWDANGIESIVQGNLLRIENAKERTDVTSLIVPFGCLAEDSQQQQQQKAIEELLALQDRNWTFRMIHIPPSGLHSNMSSTFDVLQKVVVNLQLFGQDSRIPTEVPKDLGPFQKLRELHFSNFCMNQDSLLSLEQCLCHTSSSSSSSSSTTTTTRQTLKHLSFHSCWIPRFSYLLNILKSTKYLQVLRLRRCGLEDMDIVNLVNVLKTYPSLQVLNIGENSRASHNALMALANWIGNGGSSSDDDVDGSNQTCRLRVLDLTGLWKDPNQYSTSSSSKEPPLSLLPLFQAIGKNRSLEMLSLHYEMRNIDTAKAEQEEERIQNDMKVLATSIRTNGCSLKYLDVGFRSYPRICGKGLLYQLLQDCPNLLSVRNVTSNDCIRCNVDLDMLCLLRICSFTLKTKSKRTTTTTQQQQQQQQQQYTILPPSVWPQLLQYMCEPSFLTNFTPMAPAKCWSCSSDAAPSLVFQFLQERLE